MASIANQSFLASYQGCPGSVTDDMTCRLKKLEIEKGNWYWNWVVWRKKKQLFSHQSKGSDRGIKLPYFPESCPDQMYNNLWQCRQDSGDLRKTDKPCFLFSRMEFLHTLHSQSQQWPINANQLSRSCQWYEPWRHVVLRMVNHFDQLPENWGWMLIYQCHLSPNKLQLPFLQHLHLSSHPKALWASTSTNMITATSGASYSPMTTWIERKRTTLSIASDSLQHLCTSQKRPRPLSSIPTILTSGSSGWHDMVR